jgi:hypothetical protein
MFLVHHPQHADMSLRQRRAICHHIFSGCRSVSILRYPVCSAIERPIGPGALDLLVDGAVTNASTAPLSALGHLSPMQFEDQHTPANGQIWAHSIRRAILQAE